ncbi:MAG: RNA polymerase subunit sigma-70, partial [Clostridiales bacterium]|nr:RNA polymerase subunit sigma-70 [Clostridiales bacterium]
MTDEQLVEKFRMGNKSALDVLLNRFKPMVKAKAKAYYVAGGDSEDLIQEGMLGLLSAVRTFDPARDVLFRTYAEACVRKR